MMTGGQTSLRLSSGNDSTTETSIRRLENSRKVLKVIHATADELTAHQDRLDLIGKKADVIWRL